MPWEVGIADVRWWLEQWSQYQSDDQAGHKTSDVGKVRHTAHGLLRTPQRCYTIEKLQQEPEPDQDYRWQRHNSEENEDENDRTHLCKREQYKVSRQHPRDGAAGPETRYG